MDRRLVGNWVAGVDDGLCRQVPGAGQAKRIGGNGPFDGENKQLAEGGCICEVPVRTPACVAAQSASFSGERDPDRDRWPCLRNPAARTFATSPDPRTPTFIASPLVGECSLSARSFQRGLSVAAGCRIEHSCTHQALPASGTCGMLNAGLGDEFPRNDPLQAKYMGDRHRAGVGGGGGGMRGVVAAAPGPPPKRSSGRGVRGCALIGRLVDGMLLDVRSFSGGRRPGADDARIQLPHRRRGIRVLPGHYCDGGIVDPAEVRAGFPCSVRYQPGSPQNSIIVAEEWSGLRVACRCASSRHFPASAIQGITHRRTERRLERRCAQIPMPRLHLSYACPRGARRSGGANRTQSVLRISLVATLAYVAVTFVAGLRAHSLALLSEAGHNVSDFLALLLSFAAVYFQSRPATIPRPSVISAPACWRPSSTRPP